MVKYFNIYINRYFVYTYIVHKSPWTTIYLSLTYKLYFKNKEDWQTIEEEKHWTDIIVILSFPFYFFLVSRIPLSTLCTHKREHITGKTMFWILYCIKINLSQIYVLYCTYIHICMHTTHVTKNKERKHFFCYSKYFVSNFPQKFLIKRHKGKWKYTFQVFL